MKKQFILKEEKKENDEKIPTELKVYLWNKMRRWLVMTNVETISKNFNKTQEIMTKTRKEWQKLGKNGKN